MASRHTGIGTGAAAGYIQYRVPLFWEASRYLSYNSMLNLTAIAGG